MIDLLLGQIALEPDEEFKAGMFVLRALDRDRTTRVRVFAPPVVTSTRNKYRCAEINFSRKCLVFEQTAEIFFVPADPLDEVTPQ